MARVTAECTCRKCGAKFEKTEFKRNRTEADSWKAWAEIHIDTCPDCYKEQQEDALKDSPFEFDELLTIESGNICLVYDSVGSNSYARREDLKANGFTWTGSSWQRRIPVEPKENLEEFKAALLDLINSFRSSIGPAKYHSVKLKQVEDAFQAAADHKAKLAERAAKLATKPEYPAEFQAMKAGKRWNGRVYRGKKDIAVYLNSEKIVISPELADAIEATEKALEAWKQS